MRVLSVLLLGFMAAAISQAAQTTTVTVPIKPSLEPPPITLQRALAIAEKFVSDQKIEIGRYWLQECRLLRPVNDNPQVGPAWSGWRWFFFWNNLGTGKGDYVEIEVDMSGHAIRRPSQ